MKNILEKTCRTCHRKYFTKVPQQKICHICKHKQLNNFANPDELEQFTNSNVNEIANRVFNELREMYPGREKLGIVFLRFAHIFPDIWQIWVDTYYRNEAVQLITDVKGMLEA